MSFTGITSTLGAGTAANGGQAAANAGQAITITGTGLDTTTDVVFRTIDGNGNKGQSWCILFGVAAPDGKSATVTVPANAITDVVRVVGDSTGDDVPLQIVPVIASMTVNSVASDGTRQRDIARSVSSEAITAPISSVTTNIPDGTTSFYQGPQVSSSGSIVTITVPLNAGSYGPITVTTQGGVSAAPFMTVTLTLANADRRRAARPRTRCCPRRILARRSP